MRFAPLIGAFTLSQAFPQAHTGTHSLAAKRAGDLKVVLLADTNRDGKVDMAGDSDRAGKETWTTESGALFLANIADTDGRCSSQITGRCGEDLGDIFRENFVPPPEPTIFGKTWDEWIRETAKLWKSKDKKDEEEWQALKKSPEYIKYSRESPTWRWATGPGLIENCHDASDKVMRNAALLAPLRTVPNPELSDAATGSITVSDEAAASKVRIFHNKGNTWEYVGPDYTFSAGELKAGLELGLDGRDVRRPNGGWDGKALVKLTVRDGDGNASDSVALRVAPVLTHHHGQLAEQLFVSKTNRKEQLQFISDLEAVSNSVGMKRPVHRLDMSGCRFGNGEDTWAQDFFEPGYTSIPGPDGPVGLRIMIRSSQASRNAGRRIFQELRSSEVGAVQHLVNGREHGTSESMGNLETIPPYTHNGKAYPAGRAIMGSWKGEKPVMMDFLEAQEVQKPLMLNTSWLHVGHVDEFLQFLPAKSERKWVMVVSDPKAGLELLQKAQEAGHGAVRALSRVRRDSDPYAAGCLGTDTISELLENEGFAAFQERSAQAIEENVDLIKQETGIAEAEIIRLPALFYPKGKYSLWTCKGFRRRRRQVEARAEQEPPTWDESEAANMLGELEEMPVSWEGATSPAPVAAQNERRDELQLYTALFPATINSVVLSDSKVLAPNPWGPVIEGKDMLVEATNAAYAKANFTVEYMDDWYTHHTSSGEVHCGTNVVRERTGQWW